MIVLSDRFAEARAYSLLDESPSKLYDVLAVTAAVAEARRLVAVGLDLVGRASASYLPAVAVAAKAMLACNPSGAVGPAPERSGIAPADLAAANEGPVRQLVTSPDQLRNVASQKLSRRQGTWRAHALALAEWLSKARKARKSGDHDVAVQARHVWAAPSQACHRYPYDVAPGAEELGGWSAVVRHMACLWTGRAQEEAARHGG
jgi:hypothetical protein